MTEQNSLYFQQISVILQTPSAIVHESSGTFSHLEGPATAATVMCDHLKEVYDGRHLNISLSNNVDTTLPLPITNAPADHALGIFDASRIEDFIMCLPRRKAPGSDHLRAEMLRPIKSHLASLLSLFFQLCWSWSTVPRSWRQAQVFPIHKKGDPTLPSNYRPISLTSILRKLLEMVLQKAVKLYSPKLDIAQGGFRTRRSALDQALCLHDLIQDYHQQHQGHYPVVAFLDIKQAYDTVSRDIIWKALRLSGTPLPLLALLRHLFDDVFVSVLVGNCSSPSFSPVTGVLQGSVLSPLLYSIYINSLPGLLRPFASAKTTRVTVPGSGTSPAETVAINSLLFADDVAIFGSKREVMQMLNAVAQHSTDLGYRWNPLKCAVVNHPPGRTPSGIHLDPLKLYNIAIPQVDEFVYLGIPFLKSGISGTAMAKLRTPGTIAAMSTLHKMGAHRSGFSLLLSSKLYKTFIRPKFEYGLAIAHLFKKDLALFEKIQDKCLRLIVGGHPTSSTQVLKIITNLPSVAWRVDALVTKYCLRVRHLPKNCLLVCLQDTMSSRTRLNSSLKKNTLYTSLPEYAAESRDGLLSYLNEARQTRLDTFFSSTSQVLAKACRPELGLDPIVFLPATRTDRSRLIRWRMGWLPGNPHECLCTQDHTSRRHFNKYDCPAIPTDIWDALPHAPPGVHPIDNAISMLPLDTKDYQTFWPALLTLLWYVEILVNPSGYFPEDPDPGALWRDHNRTTVPTANSDLNKDRQAANSRLLNS